MRRRSELGCSDLNTPEVSFIKRVTQTKTNPRSRSISFLMISVSLDANFANEKKEKGSATPRAKRQSFGTRMAF